MIIIFLLILLIISNALCLRRDMAILYNRVVIIVLLYAILQCLVRFSLISSNGGIGLPEGGLFHVTTINDFFNFQVFIGIFVIPNSNIGFYFYTFLLVIFLLYTFIIVVALYKCVDIILEDKKYISLLLFITNIFVIVLYFLLVLIGVENIFCYFLYFIFVLLYIIVNYFIIYEINNKYNTSIFYYLGYFLEDNLIYLWVKLENSVKYHKMYTLLFLCILSLNLIILPPFFYSLKLWSLNQICLESYIMNMVINFILLLLVCIFIRVLNIFISYIVLEKFALKKNSPFKSYLKNKFTLISIIRLIFFSIIFFYYN